MHLEKFSVFSRVPLGYCREEKRGREKKKRTAATYLRAAKNARLASNSPQKSSSAATPGSSVI